MSIHTIHPASFRDPSGFLFSRDGILYRQVNRVYGAEYDEIMSSGLYDELTGKGWLVSHTEVQGIEAVTSESYKIIRPELVEFISYPYEWSFTQLKDAALLTLKIQKEALKRGMTLRDASAYNVQFSKGRPVFIDTLSFGIYHENQPWEAYGQFCRHFLAPLALMSYTHIDLNQLQKLYLEGIPLDVASTLLPFKTRFNISLYLHIHMHARLQKKYEHTSSGAKEAQLSRKNLSSLIQGLYDTVKNLKLSTKETQWSGYYSFTNYSDNAFRGKKEIISSFLDNINARRVWDMGANTGIFTRIAAAKGATCVAFDIDPLAVDAFYRENKKLKETHILPLVMNLTNPSPAIGWNNRERMDIQARTLPDTIMALALIHHLCISNNLPFWRVAEFFSELAANLIIEFVPKSDTQVQKLLASREDIFIHYDQESFEQAFSAYYSTEEKQPIPHTQRTLYRMKRINKVSTTK